MFRALTRTAVITGGVLVGARIRHETKSSRWIQRPDRRGTMVQVDGRRVFARVRGGGSPTVVICTDLLSPSASWWPVQDRIARTCTVLTYDRPGAGWSAPGTTPRSSPRIVDELRDLIHALDLPGPFILVGHGQGALYAQHVARDLGEDVAGVVLLDPVTTNLEQLRNRLGLDQHRRGGADRSTDLRWARWTSALGLRRLSRPLPARWRGFGAYRNLPTDLRDICWQHLMLDRTLEAAEEELFANGTRANTDRVLDAGPFPAAPVRVLWHDPDVEVARQSGWGSRWANRDDVAAVEAGWTELARSEIGGFGEDVRWRAIEGAGHDLHLEAADEVVATIEALVASASGRTEEAA